jgi:hypothetical protein
MATRHAHGRRRKAESTAIADRKMSGFQTQLPGGPGTTAPDSERDPMAEADQSALSRIRSMCGVAMTSAEGVAQPIHTDMTRLHRLRLASAKRMSLELAMTISDASYRDAALQHIIELCMTANDLEASRILLPGIQSETIREELFRTYPILLP